MLFDGTDVYTQQLPFLSVDTTTNTLDTLSGIGNIWWRISGSNLILKFYPDNQNQQVDIEVFNKSLYSRLDSVNNIIIYLMALLLKVLMKNSITQLMVIESIELISN